MYKGKRLISLILSLIMLFTMVPSTFAMASESMKSESTVTEGSKSEENVYYAVNPLYKDVISIDDLKKKLDSEAESSEDSQFYRASSGQYFSDYKDASSYIRKQMVSRSTEISLSFPSSWFDTYDAVYWDLLNDAMKCDDNSTGQEGDALIYGYAGCRTSISSVSGYIKYTMLYHSDANQEEQLTNTVNVAMTELSLNGLTEAKKIKKNS